MNKKIHGESNVWSTPHGQKRSTDLMFILGLNETIDWLAMANSVRCNGHMMRREDGHVLRRSLHFEAEEMESEHDLDEAGRGR